MSQQKRRSFLHWLFFQNADKRRPPRPVKGLLPDYSEESQREIPRQPDLSNSIDTAHETPDGAHVEATRPAPAPAAASNKWIRLAIRSEKVQSVIELDSFPVEIGSVKSSFKLKDKGVSPRHAVMDLHTDMLSIVDTHSQNGVYIGDNLIEPGVAYPVFPGDTIIVGNTEITVIDYSRNGDDTEPDFAEPAGQEEQISPPGTPEPGIPAAAEMPVEPEQREAPAAPEAQAAPAAPVNAAEKPKPIPEPEPQNTTSTIMKLLDKPDASLIRDVLDMGELPDENAAEAKPERQLTSNDIEETLREPEPVKEPVKESTPPWFAESDRPPMPVMALTAEEFIDALVDESSHADLLPELTLAEQLASMDIETPPPPAQTDAQAEPEPVKAPSSCNKCGTANGANDKFCGKCGSPLKAPPPAVKAFCGQCGAKNANMTKFCGECGYKLG